MKYLNSFWMEVMLRLQCCCDLINISIECTVYFSPLNCIIVTSDSDGDLFIATFGGGKIIKIDPMYVFLEFYLAYFEVINKDTFTLQRW